ncbi:protein WHAT'S THIS FACTOR 1, chloroplastic [Sesamum angolense]|uniref:Protein WHAT'S THIS FACTOR 1, chloroplastic n=1 Tax=Sesamum angolense TaxID=2727404 RepID=A0AAE2BY30_9LAMI|nr:protein WHAT'S THIS FACTOR 1, chloroplastic [Sesamum angolense]
MEKRARREGESRTRITCSMNLPRGFDLQKRVLEWVDEWQNLPYISPYENAFHLAPNSDQAEKWAVGVIHELLSLLVSKKTERENVFCLGEFWGFERVRFKKALVHFPGIFYVSNKIRTQLYISLMNMVLRRGKPIRNGVTARRKGSASSSKGGKRKNDGNMWRRSDDEED